MLFLLWFIAQTTPPTTHKIRTIRRQSSIGAYHDHPPYHPPPTSHSVPVTGSAGYFTNSPSPPTTHHETHSSGPHDPTIAHDTRQQEPASGEPSARHLGYISQIEQNLASVVQGAYDSASAADPTAAPLHSKTLLEQSDVLVISRNQFDSMNHRLDQLSRRVQSLETSLASDIRLILQLVQGKAEGGGATTGSLATTTTTVTTSSCLTTKPIKEVRPNFAACDSTLTQFLPAGGVRKRAVRSSKDEILLPEVGQWTETDIQCLQCRQTFAIFAQVSRKSIRPDLKLNSTACPPAIWPKELRCRLNFPKKSHSSFTTFW